MIKNAITVDGIIAILNEAIFLDQKAMENLFKNSKVICNEKLANHPTIQIGKKDDNFTLSTLGIINGMFGIDKNGSGAICAMYDDETGKLIEFKKLSLVIKDK